MKNKYLLLFFFGFFISFKSLALKPKKEYILTPDSVGLKYKELQIATPDKYMLNTWVMCPEKKVDNKTVMIVAYGDALNMSYWVEQCLYFVKAGFTVITFDYRGFGHSSTFAMDSNQLYYEEFAADLESVVGYAKKEFSGYKVGVRALSMGTAITTIVCGRTHIDYFVGDSFICDPIAVQASLQAMTNRIFTVPASAKDYKDALNKLDVPMLVFAGTKDGNTPLSDSKQMVEGHLKRKLITYDGEHLEGIFVLSESSFGDLYIADIVDFLKGI